MKTLHKFTLIAALLMFANGGFAQESDLERGLELYNKGDYPAAVKLLKKATKADPQNATAQISLALALVKTDKLKDAENAVGKALAIDSNNLKARKALAYINLLRGKLDKAVLLAGSLVSAGTADFEVYYILGAANLQLGDPDEALKNVEEAIKLNDKFASLYLLKAHALMNNGKGTKNYGELAKKYGTAGESIRKFVLLSADPSVSSFWNEQQEELKFFAEYYAAREKAAGSAENKNAIATPVKILSKEQAVYTDRARNAGISGTITLLVAFGEDAKISHILVLNSLGYGLDEQAVKAAKGIEFTPATENGKPVTTAKIVVYSFTIF